jgi:hypothetical protein
MTAPNTLIAVESASFKGTTIPGVREASYQEREVLADEEVRGGNLLVVMDDVRIVAKPFVTLLSDDADRMFFDDGIAAGDNGTLVVVAKVARAASTKITITMTNMVAGPVDSFRLPGQQAPRVQVGRSFEPTHETVLTKVAS